jgi:hypothetical protein
VAGAGLLVGGLDDGVRAQPAGGPAQRVDALVLGAGADVAADGLEGGEGREEGGGEEGGGPWASRLAAPRASRGVAEDGKLGGVARRFEEAVDVRHHRIAQKVGLAVRALEHGTSLMMTMERSSSLKGRSVTRSSMSPPQVVQIMCVVSVVDRPAPT